MIRNADSRVIPLKDGPLAVGMKMILSNLSARTENGDAVLCARYSGGCRLYRLASYPCRLPYGCRAVELQPVWLDDAFTDTEVLNLGLNLSYPESECSGMR